MGLPQGPVLRRSNSAPILHRGELIGSERPSNLRGQSTAGPARSPPPLRSRRGSKSSNSGGERARMGSPLAARCSTMGNVPSPFLLRRGSNPSNPRSPPFSRRGSREPSQSPLEPNNNPRASPRCSASPPLASRPSLLPLDGPSPSAIYPPAARPRHPRHPARRWCPCTRCTPPKLLPVRGAGGHGHNRRRGCRLIGGVVAEARC
eukprot:scaffold15040_cov71-Phaeocystis_antarctica.AAC.1